MCSIIVEAGLQPKRAEITCNRPLGVKQTLVCPIFPSYVHLINRDSGGGTHFIPVIMVDHLELRVVVYYH